MTTTGTDAAFLNLLDPGFRFDTAQVRAAAAANWYARTSTGIVVLRYRECAALMRDRRLRRGMSSTLAKWGVETGPFAQWMQGQLLDLEGEPHHRLRGLVSGTFGQRRIAALEPFMRAKTHELVDRLTADAPADIGRCEFMTAFADPYPAWVIADMLGIPDSEFDRFVGLATDLGLGFNPAAAQNLARVEAALTGLYGYCDELIARRRVEPVDDLVSALVTAEADGDRLSTEELRSLITGLVFAGQDTTRNQLGLALQLFAEHPEQWALLTTRPELAAAAVEEVMRVRPTVTSIGRWSTEEFTFQGLRIPKGISVALLVAVANSDPAVFGDARFDITAIRPGQLTLGAGVHFCLGAWLARVEMRVALPILATRLCDIAPDGPVTSRPPIGITGPITLPLRFTPASTPRT
jgi:cytochrome P450